VEIKIDRGTLNGGGELPDFYEEDTLVLLPRDPRWVFAYWEISPDTLNRLKYQWGNETFNHAKPTLMVRRHRWDQEGEIAESTPLAITSEARNWYLEVSHPDHYYHLELGWVLGHGEFYTLMKSNTVRTPREQVSSLVDENWTLPEWKFRKLFRRISLFQVSSPELVRRRNFR